MKTNQEIAQEVLSGQWGNGDDRRLRLTEAGYNYEDVQSIVNALVYNRDQMPGAPAVQNSVETVDNRTLVIDVDLTIYDTVELNIIWGDL